MDAVNIWQAQWRLTFEGTANTITMRKLTITAAMLGVAGTLSVVGAVQAASSPSAHLKAWDTDSDGTIDRAEANKAAEAKFDKLDTDRDGTIDMKEIAPSGVGKMAFAKADVDKDGTLDKAEYLTIVDARFKAADSDNDGTISDSELKSKAGIALARLLK
jgi:Ca2+-binding EF-hand superfamily protein